MSSEMCLAIRNNDLKLGMCGNVNLNAIYLENIPDLIVFDKVIIMF